ncbi:hypothetical protein GALMADRAFT_224919 [Galerina marginata CBS 339.88]|uniref:Fatty acid hydroxylase domain-containing protein n=1 Tax=Galerina marginata (strain CBS 339.88) TaxID=685588 RepID=A0A067T3D1_GALM3|nr:hypothetical protein GALMADRAFT_224919 [Galerina marginata CBS 339.88]
MATTQLWLHLLDQYSSSTIEFAGTSIVQFVFFWTVSAIYIALPYIAPKFSARHKLQKTEKLPTPSELWDCLTIVTRNQVITSMIHGVLIILRGRQPVYRVDAILPGLVEILRDVTLAALFHDILYYYTHRLIHHPSLYPAIHKLHHHFTAPVALASQYATPAEHLFSNLMPVVLPFIILKVHIVTFWAGLAFDLMQTSTFHSGFDFFAGNARFHDAHHEKFVVNFGSVGLLDWLHGTRDSKSSYLYFNFWSIL